MTLKPTICATCRQPLTQPKRGRARVYCSTACRKSAFRSRQVSFGYLPQIVKDAEATVAGISTDEQVARAVIEARSVGLALVRLGAEARPEFAWRCAKAGEAITEALADSFKDVF